MSSIDDFFAELAELEKQQQEIPAPSPDLRIPFSLLEVGKSEVYEIRPQKTHTPPNGVIDITTVCRKYIFNFLILLINT